MHLLPILSLSKYTLLSHAFELLQLPSDYALYLHLAIRPRQTVRRVSRKTKHVVFERFLGRVHTISTFLTTKSTKDLPKQLAILLVPRLFVECQVSHSKDELPEFARKLSSVEDLAEILVSTFSGTGVFTFLITSHK